MWYLLIKRGLYNIILINSIFYKSRKIQTVSMADLFGYIHLWENLIIEAAFSSNITELFNECKLCCLTHLVINKY